MTGQPSPAAPQSAEIACDVHGDFTAWIARSGGSLAVSTYQAGKVAMIGWDGRQTSLLMREFDKPMGMATTGRRLALATRHQVLELANAPELAHDYLPHQPGRYDGLYLPRVSYFCGDVNIHDLGYDKQGLVAVVTRFCCLARLTPDFSFEPFWRPSFISDLAPEDRCHLNGMAIVDGEVRYVTALGTTDSAGAWREKKGTGGVILDVPSGEIVASGLCMPHSPRWHSGRLFFLDSGQGDLCLCDPASGQKTVVCRLPGYLRGLDFVGPYAVVGLSKIRERHIFGGLPVQEREKHLQCGVVVVDLRTGGLVGMFEFTTGCEELYEARFLPGVQRPMILNPDKEAVKESITNPESSFWLRPEFEKRDEAPEASSARSESDSSIPSSQNLETVQSALAASTSVVR